jgi:hypothetical protein
MITPTVDTNSDSGTNHKLTEEEASRYDRQMRLWGLEAQQRCISIESTCFRLKNLD